MNVNIHTLGFEDLLAKIREFTNTHKRFPFTSENRALCFRLNEIRYRKAMGQLSVDEVNALNDLGFNWDKASANREEKFLISFLKDFGRLQRFLSNHKRFPQKEDDDYLHAIILKYRSKKTKNELPLFVENKLNEIGFIWDKQKNNWKEKYSAVLTIILNGKIELKADSKLNSWFNRQLFDLKRNLLNQEKKIAMEQLLSRIKQLQTAHPVSTEVLPTIVRNKEPKVSLRKIRETSQLKKLRDFKATHQYWPKADAKNSEEKKLGIWCQSLRQRYKRNTLSVELVSDLNAINFNLEGRKDNWKEKLQLLQSYIETNNELPNVKSSLFDWGEKQFKKLENLSKQQQQEFKASSFIPLYQKRKDIWGGHFEKLVQFKNQFSTLPTLKTNPRLFIWIKTQLAKFREGKLGKDQAMKLKKLGIKLTHVTSEQKWGKTYQDLIDFKELNGRWPSYYADNSVERQLYVWCQSQRRFISLQANCKNPPIQVRIEKLKEINFHFSLTELNNLKWDEMFEKTRTYYIKNKGKPIPCFVDGKSFDVYTWLRKQKRLNSEGNLENEKMKKLKSWNLI